MSHPAPSAQFSFPQPKIDLAARPLPGLDLPRGGPSPGPRRERIWELSPSLHCSIIGTCLPTGALRQLFARLNQPDARTASDHDLHSRAVRIAGQRDIAGKMLNRMLEKRHEVHVKRFARARSVDDVRAAWLEALERGEIPGAYWAALTHPATDQTLVAEVFGEVHMLSHLVGTSNRADIARLRDLERSLGEREEKIARQEARLRIMAAQRDEMCRRIDMLESELKRRPCEAPVENANGEIVCSLRQRLADEQARSAALAARLEEQDRALTAGERAACRMEEQNRSLQQELASLEAALDEGSGETANSADGAPDLAGKRLLYVGGRPRQLERLRAVAERLGGTLLTHDGGMEESTAMLPGLLGQADAAFFPVDCVSHRAAGQVKRFCRESGKPFIPLRNSGTGSFLAALGELARASGDHA